jgi:hypothetical protein
LVVPVFLMINKKSTPRGMKELPRGADMGNDKRRRALGRDVPLKIS